MNKKILISLSVVVVVAAIAIGATTAFFSDTETSVGNTFTAGAIDLKVDSTQHYNNAICVDGHWALNSSETATVPQFPVIGTPCGGTWVATDLGATNKFFDFTDIKPGDSGEDTISLHVINNDAWVCAEVSNLTNSDNGTTEPESTALGNTAGGDLQNALVMTIWKDDGVDSTGVVTGKCDNIHQDGEAILASGHPVNGVLPVYDSTTGNGALPGDSTTCLGVSWSLPLAIGNEVQTDSMTGDISFNVVQSRNNASYVCGQDQTEPATTTLLLENKNAQWQEILGDSISGTLTFKSSYPTFDYSLAVNGLIPSTSYILLYYADPYPSVNGMQIGTPFTTDGSGNASVSDNVDLNADLTNAKLWVIPASQWGGTGVGMNAWTPLEYLHEHELINYNDTNN